MNDLFVMNMKRKILFVCLSFLALLQGWAQHTWQAGPVNLELIQRGNSEFPSGFSAFSLKNRFIWCGSAIHAEFVILRRKGLPLRAAKIVQIGSRTKEACLFLILKYGLYSRSKESATVMI